MIFLFTGVILKFQPLVFRVVCGMAPGLVLYHHSSSSSHKLLMCWTVWGGLLFLKFPCQDGGKVGQVPKIEVLTYVSSM